MGLTSGNYQKFLASDKMQAEQLLKEVMRNGNIIDIADDGVSALGYQKYAIIFDAEKVIGTRGETFVKVVITTDGGMLSAFP